MAADASGLGRSAARCVGVGLVTENSPPIRVYLVDDHAVVRCARGYVVTGPDLLEETPGTAGGRSPLPLETSVPGLFAAGDVRHRSTKRVASAAGEGAMVVALVHEHLARPSAPTADACAPNSVQRLHAAGVQAQTWARPGSGRLMSRGARRR